MKTGPLKKMLSFIMLSSMLALTACSSGAKASESEKFLPEAQNDTIVTSVGGGNNADDNAESSLRVSFIDVGHGDSEFIELPNGETLLIDAGTNETGADVVSYISSLGYTSIDYVVGTHPHEDHIGGLDDVIRTFDIGSVYMPKVTADTKTFEDVLDAVAEKGLSINTAKAGVSIVDVEDLSVKMLAPVLDEYDNTNDYSAVIKVVYGDTSFLFTGDAEEYAESLITGDVDSDVLKVGHHGSSTSTGEAFLERVSPSYAVISCGLGNSYGHPHTETIEKLGGIPVFRTDEMGTIVATSEGSEISFRTLGKSDTGNAAQPEAPQDTETAASSGYDEGLDISDGYILNTNSKKIHLPDCSAVDNMSDSNKAYTDDYDQAISEGYTPCKICNP